MVIYSNDSEVNFSQGVMLIFDFWWQHLPENLAPPQKNLKISKPHPPLAKNIFKI